MDRTGTTSTQVPLYFPLFSLHVSSKPQHGPMLWPAAKPQDSAIFFRHIQGKGYTREGNEETRGTRTSGSE
jgi:hypothetical protein